MWTVIRRELKTYFYTPAAYVFLSVFWLIGGIFFYLYNILSRTADLSPLFGNLSYVLMLLSPLLTMRLVSDEKKRRTETAEKPIKKTQHEKLITMMSFFS